MTSTLPLNLEIPENDRKIPNQVTDAISLLQAQHAQALSLLSS